MPSVKSFAFIFLSYREDVSETRDPHFSLRLETGFLMPLPKDFIQKCKRSCSKGGNPHGEEAFLNML